VNGTTVIPFTVNDSMVYFAVLPYAGTAIQAVFHAGGAQMVPNGTILVIPLLSNAGGGNAATGYTFTAPLSTDLFYAVNAGEHVVCTAFMLVHSYIS